MGSTYHCLRTHPRVQLNLTPGRHIQRFNSQKNQKGIRQTRDHVRKAPSKKNPDLLELFLCGQLLSEQMAWTGFVGRLVGPYTHGVTAATRCIAALTQRGLCPAATLPCSMVAASSTALSGNLSIYFVPQEQKDSKIYILIEKLFCLM